MKKTISLALVMLFVIPALAFSQEKSEEGTPMGKGMMMQKGMMGEAKEGMQKKHAMMDMMMPMMMQKQMVATSDGGVVVLVGNKLYKYDKNLNLVKEAEIKMDFEAMKKMEKMKEKCSMHEKMMQGKEEATEEKE